MNPGHSQILTCPYCGEKKEIMSLISGNTFGATIWSDNKRVAPMLPDISVIQKCPKCRKYYFRTRQEAVFSEDDYSFDRGVLTFPEMKEAFKQLSEEGFKAEKEEANARMMLHHAYNDFYYRENADGKPVEEKDFTLFKDNALWIIEHVLTDGVLKAEFYREMGMFEEAESALSSLSITEDFLKDIADKIKERIKEKDSCVFKIN
jgi:hypothetical protein